MRHTEGDIIPPEDVNQLEGGMEEPPRAKKLLKECAVAGLIYHVKPDDEFLSDFTLIQIIFANFAIGLAKDSP